jgi:drug/metabolite transporter (DMT)-like permease
MTAGVRPLLGDLLALLGAIFVAGYMLIGRSLRRTLPLLTYVFPVYLAAAVTLGLVCLVTGTPLGPFRPEIWLLLLLLAVVPQVIGHSLLNWSLKHLKTYVVAMAVLGEPIGASLLTLLLFREIPGSMVVIGGGVILGGVFLAIHGERGQKVIR